MLTERTPIQMELEEAEYSEGWVQGIVLFDLLGNFKKGDFFKSRITDIKFFHGYVLFKTPMRVVQIYLSTSPRQ